jgi:hypothetical protein
VTGSERARPTIARTPDALEVQRLVVGGRLTPSSAVSTIAEGDEGSLRDSGPDPTPHRSQL